MSLRVSFDLHPVVLIYASIIIPIPSNAGIALQLYEDGTGGINWCVGRSSYAFDFSGMYT